MFYIVKPTPFKNSQKPSDVAVDISCGLFQRVTHTRLSRQIDNHFKLLLLKQIIDCIAVSQICLDKSVPGVFGTRSEEHTSELQSRGHLVCRLLLEKKKNSTEIS